MQKLDRSEIVTGRYRNGDPIEHDSQGNMLSQEEALALSVDEKQANDENDQNNL